LVSRGQGGPARSRSLGNESLEWVRSRSPTGPGVRFEHPVGSFPDLKQRAVPAPCLVGPRWGPRGHGPLRPRDSRGPGSRGLAPAAAPACARAVHRTPWLVPAVAGSRRDEMALVFAQPAPPCLSKWPSRSSSTPAKAEAGGIGSLSACEPVMPAPTGLHRLGQTSQTPPASCKPWSRTICFTHQDQAV
jgi:hypothetical protein